MKLQPLRLPSAKCIFDFVLFLVLSLQVTGFESLSVTAAGSHRLTRATKQRTLIRLFEEPPPSSSPTGASVRFSGTDAGSTQTMSPLDTFLSYMSSDIASIILGAIGLLVIVAHRWSLLDESVDTLAVQTRTDLLAVFACGSVLLNGITKLDVTAALSESVVLEGTTLEQPEVLSTTTSSTDTVAWVMTSLLAATPAKSVVLLQRSPESTWSVAARAGVVSSNVDVPDNTPILDRVGSPGNTKETYLPTVQALPGKRELTYLPSNAQLALMIPVGDSSSQVLVVGGNTAKSFTPRDVAWCRIVAERLGQ